MRYSYLRSLDNETAQPGLGGGDLRSAESRKVSPISVMVVDGQHMVRDGIARLLDEDDRIDVVSVSAGGPDTARQCAARHVDVVVTDIDLDNLDGIEMVREVRSESPSTAVLVLTSSVDWRIFAVMAAGASGFLLKDAAPESVTDAISSVQRGEQVLCREAAEWLSDDAPGGKRLTRREVAVLQLVAKGATNGEIADALGISEKTVRNHVSSLYRKLSLRNRVQIAAYASQARISSSSRRTRSVNSVGARPETTGSAR